MFTSLALQQGNCFSNERIQHSSSPMAFLFF